MVGTGTRTTTGPPPNATSARPCAPLVADAFVRFVRARGTPAPVAETELLVTSGPYRWMRNPQYVDAIAMVAGQGLRWNSHPVLAYAGYLAVAFHMCPDVRGAAAARAFGAVYERYTASVPRWPQPVPR